MLDLSGSLDDDGVEVRIATNPGPKKKARKNSGAWDRFFPQKKADPCQIFLSLFF